MAMSFYASITGTTQGDIKGGCTQKGHEGKIICFSQMANVFIPVDPQSAQPKGKRTYEPFTITKEFDKSSPKLLQVLSTGETLTKVLFEYFRINAQGKEEKYFTIQLENAIVVGLHKWVPNCLDPDWKTYGHMEDVSFTYEKVIWTAVVDGKEAQDSWKIT